MTKLRSEEDFPIVIDKIRAYKETIARFQSREEGVARLSEATGLSRQACETGRDFVIDALAAHAKKSCSGAARHVELD